MNNPNASPKSELNSESNSENSARNDHAEWAALKEIGKYNSSGSLSIKTELDLPLEEREGYRQRGKALLDAINNLPDRPDKAEKSAMLDEIYQNAEASGIKNDLTEAIRRQLDPNHGDRIGKETFADENDELTAEELAEVEKLRERVFDLTTAESGALADKFPSGTFLYHGSTIPRLEKIFQSGGLKNGVALAEDNPDIKASDLNSGFEGLSWSMNIIDALPGTRGHIAGFVAAPEDILSESEQLVIPSRPAPGEVLQTGGKLNADELYRLKNQHETWGDSGVSFGEKNNVRQNLIRMLIRDPNNQFLSSSLVYDYKGDTSPEAMRKLFQFGEAGYFSEEVREFYEILNQLPEEEQDAYREAVDLRVRFDDDLYQKSEVPPALPWFQALIDRGSFERAGHSDLTNVSKVIEYAKDNKEFLQQLLGTAKFESQPVEDAYEKALDDASAIRIPPENLYFVTSHRDLDAWLKVMARNHVVPKGILLYDDTQVILENFAGDYEGNHAELSAEIGHAIGANPNFWSENMGFDPTKLPRSGHKGQVLLESAVKENRKHSLRMIDGKLTTQ